MAATDISTNYTGNFDQAKVHLEGDAIERTRYFDCSNVTLAAATEYKVMRMPAGAIIDEVIINVITAEGGTCIMDVGLDGTAGATAFETDVDMDTANITKSADDMIYLSSADWITVTPSTELGTCVFTLTVVYRVVSSDQEAVANDVNN